MLTKLLRYEFKSTGRVVLPIAAGVLVLNIFTNILSHFIQNTSDRLPLAGVAMALLALASAVSLLVVLAICFFVATGLHLISVASLPRMSPSGLQCF